MSAQVMAWVMEHSPTEGKERLVLLSIANHADPDGGGAWPSLARIAREARVHPDTVKRFVRQLHNGGHITRVVGGSPDERIPQGRRPNLYVVTLKLDQIEALRKDRGGPMGGSELPGVRTTPGQTIPGSELPGMGGSELPPKSSLDPSPNRPPCRNPRIDPWEADFEEWWKHYPRKLKKPAALKAYSARRRAGAGADDLLAAVKRYAASRRGKEPEFTSHGSSFLNNGWDDWLPGGAAEAEARAPARGTGTYHQSNGRSIQIDPGLQAQARGRSRAEW